MKLSKKLREFRYRLFSWRHYDEIPPLQEEIDVVIPITKKDLHILPLCLEGVRRFVNHPIRQIYVVARESEEVTSFCKEQGLVFVEETTVLGFGPKDMKLYIAGSKDLDRSGWLFQQLLKLSGKVGTCNNYLCIDADHVLIHPHTFMSADGKTVFYMSYEEHLPYYDNIRRLLPGLKLASLSYVDHKMLFNRNHLSELHRALEANGSIEGKTWVEKIMNAYDRNVYSGFSEFETYGNFVREKHLRPWLQKRLSYKKLTDIDTLIRKYGRSRWSITYPAYMNK